MNNEVISIDLLQKPLKAIFFDELDKCVGKIRPSQAKAIFQVLIEDLSLEIPTATAKAIFQTMSTMVQDETNLRIFIASSFASAIPILQQFKKSIFDFFYILISKEPNIINESLRNSFESLIQLDPQKTLILIANIAMSFNDIDDPWCVVDLLLTQYESFIEPTLIIDYLSLLVFLIKTYPAYRRERARNVWKRMVCVTESEDIACIRSAYCALAELSKVYESGRLNASLLKKHLKIEDLQQTVLSFLIVAPLAPENFESGGLLGALLQAAQRDVKASLVLLKLAQDSVLAVAILSVPGWMGKKLPTPTDTFRIVLALFQHKTVRKSLGESAEFIDFLNLAVRMKRQGVIAALCTIIRRISASEEFVTALSESGFLESFYLTAVSICTDATLHAALLLTDRVAETAYVPELLDACEIIVDVLRTGGPLAEAAAQVAANLVVHKKCARLLRERGADELMENAETSSMRRIAKQYFRGLSGRKERS